jgi:hypothetical protein
MYRGFRAALVVPLHVVIGACTQAVSAYFALSIPYES